MGGKAAASGRRRADDFTVTGAGMCLVGGAFLAISIPLAWVVLSPTELNVFDLMSAKFLLIVILIAELLGLVQAGLSAAMLRSASWPPERKKVWSVPLLALGLIIAACMAIGIIIVEMDYMQAGTYSFGPAPFFTIFGTVFCVSGALVFLLDINAKQPGAVQTQRQKGPGFTQMKQTKHARYDSECPGCGEGVSDDMAVCPHCGAVLVGGSGDIEDIDDLGDEDEIEKVR
ncbi:MAG: hypothetical protein A4E32_01737 [Methanomassiliicoccales archaeon PtaU1.Bin124]|nr:MAG: hypothetical protein A4E32_01737 [Methanomassiliicoccales archaeon PtaU1.Bin124]